MTDATPDKRPAYEPAARLLVPTGYDPDMPRPVATVAGVVLVFLRVVAGAAVLASLAFGWDDVMGELSVSIDGFDPSPAAAQTALWFVVAAGATVLVVDALLAVFVLRGRNGARVILMLVAVGSITSSFIAWWAQGQEITLDGTFMSLSFDILILLALSSRSAAAYARRHERR